MGMIKRKTLEIIVLKYRCAEILHKLDYDYIN